MQESLTLKEDIRQSLLGNGAVAVGFADVADVDPAFDRFFDNWLALQMNGALKYMENHREVRRNPHYILPGARSVISLAFPYFQPGKRDPSLPMISMYAFGRDYHKAIRSLISPSLRTLNAIPGAANRICIDSAPLPERYWAMKAGIGRLGRNGSIIIDGAGGYIFLAEILSTIHFPHDSPSTRRCIGCGRCLEVCPTKAISRDGVDARRCLSALTIETKGEWSLSQKNLMRSAPPTLFGCDRCQMCCPHNRGVPHTSIPDFQARDAVVNLSPDQLMSMTPRQFTDLFAGTPLMRTGLADMQRNSLR